jgi:hypothetical protein
VNGPGYATGDVVVGDPGIVYVSSMPPDPIYEEMTAAPAYGYVWIDGCWNWNGYEWGWGAGHWEAPRPGYVYVEPYYDNQGGRYVYSRGYWSNSTSVPSGVIVHDHTDGRPATGYYPRPNGEVTVPSHPGYYGNGSGTVVVSSNGNGGGHVVVSSGNPGQVVGNPTPRPVGQPVIVNPGRPSPEPVVVNPTPRPVGEPVVVNPTPRPNPVVIQPTPRPLPQPTPVVAQPTHGAPDDRPEQPIRYNPPAPPRPVPAPPTPVAHPAPAPAPHPLPPTNSSHKAPHHRF